MSTPAQSAEINMSDIAKEEEPLESHVKQSEADNFLQMEIERDGIIQSNWKHWQQFTMIKPNLETHFSSMKNAAKFILKLGLVGLRYVTIKCYKKHYLNKKISVSMTFTQTSELAWSIRQAS